MDSQSPTSFIPKKSFAPTPTAYQKRSVSVVLLGATVIFTVSAALSVGVFLYKGLLQNGIVSKKASLERARGAFDPALIKELERLDKRLIASKALLKDHIALSALFKALQGATSRNIRYTSLDWDLSGTDNKPEVIMHGQAKSYASVAFQSDVFAKSAIIKEPVFSDLTLDDKGNIVFTLAASVDTAALRYSSTLADDQSAGGAEAQ